eukprot:TRINITY_DN6905_c0_g1_i1.p1 TRINITY_DN6905_c0_g1~~TRINITY_DN6905_c0_g1_i1.p1  ORF type:complete len:630 (+),score=193.06 TRINITY_DN6905_c0_g1_i1:100-1989(+)
MCIRDRMGAQCSKCIPKLHPAHGPPDDELADVELEFERDSLVDPTSPTANSVRTREDSFDRHGFTKISTVEPISSAGENELQKEARLKAEAKEARRRGEEIEAKRRELQRKQEAEEFEIQRQKEQADLRREAELAEIAAAQEQAAAARKAAEAEASKAEAARPSPQAQMASLPPARALAAAPPSPSPAEGSPARRPRVNDRMAAAKKKAEQAKNKKRAELQFSAAQKAQVELLEQENQVKADYAAIQAREQLAEAAQKERAATATPQEPEPESPVAPSGDTADQYDSGEDEEAVIETADQIRERSASEAVTVKREQAILDRQQKRQQRRLKEERRVSRELEKLSTPPATDLVPLSSTPEDTIALPAPSLEANGSSEDALAAAVGTCSDGQRMELPFGELVQQHGGSLRGLEISGEAAATITEAALFGALADLPGLERIVLHNCHAVSDRVAKRLGSVCAQLTECELHACSLKNNAVMGLVSSAAGSKLTVLSLRDNLGLTDGSLMAVARNCKELRALDIRGSSVTDKSVEKVLLGCTQSIRQVWLCSAVQDVTMGALCECSNLELLGLDNCTLVPFSSLLATVQACSTLTELYLQGWTLSDSQQEKLEAAAPQVTLKGFQQRRASMESL